MTQYSKPKTFGEIFARLRSMPDSVLSVSYDQIMLALRAPRNRRRSLKANPEEILPRLLDERVTEPGGTRTITKREVIIENVLALVASGKSKEAESIFRAFVVEEKAQRDKEHAAELRIEKERIEAEKANAGRKRKL